MVVLKDVTCDVCQEIVEVTVDPNTSELEMYCDICQCITLHTSLCNGGLNSRWRYCDFDFSDDRELAKHIRVGKGEAVDSNDKPVVDKHGKAIHDQVQFSQDTMDEKIDRGITERERAKGKRPLFFSKK